VEGSLKARKRTLVLAISALLLGLLSLFFVYLAANVLGLSPRFLPPRFLLIAGAGDLLAICVVLWQFRRLNQRS